MKKRLFYFMCLCLPLLHWGQDSLPELLQQYNSQSIPYISVEELAMPKTQAVLLDAREAKEYEVSHLKGAIHVGYDHFNIVQFEAKMPNKNTTIVVYCSLGIRSEDVAEQLKTAGYTHVYNLYGGIFEWKNKGFTVYNAEEQPTDYVHVFSEDWGQWLNNGLKTHD